jgi:transcriptional regulator with XRE-family HTH domain
MATRQRPGDLGADDAHRLQANAGRELREARLGLGMSMARAARRAAMSRSQLGRVERVDLEGLTFEQVCRAARAVGLDPSFTFYRSAIDVRDKAQVAILDRFGAMLASPLRMRREVRLPIAGDQRAWDARIDDGTRSASIEAVSRIYDTQALARRISLKQRDDPEAVVVLLVVNRTLHNRRVLAEHREAFREQFPMDGAAIAHELRRGRVPLLGGIIMV